MTDISLLLGIVETENGNNWFTDGLNHDFYARLADDVWLIVQIRSQESPGFNTFVMEADEETIVRQIESSCKGFYIRSCELPVAMEGEAHHRTVKG